MLAGHSLGGFHVRFYAHQYPQEVVTERSDQASPLSPEEQEFERGWDQLMNQSARLSTRGKRVIADHSGHLIPLDRPDVVVNAMRDIVSEVRARSTGLSPH